MLLVLRCLMLLVSWLCRNVVVLLLVMLIMLNCGSGM